jgi:SAM-dependent methyltransferase
MAELSDVLPDIEGKDVLCLAAGGGQQSAVFGLLGARVTVVDFCKGQLDGDRKAAAHYGYAVSAVQADMRDLSCLQGDSLDVVYGTGSCFIPDMAPVFAGVARVLRPGGLYRADFANPATEHVDPASWDGEGYRIAVPYHVKRMADPPEAGRAPSIQFRHYMDEIFNGLLDAGFSIQRVFDPSRHRQPDPDGPPGSWRHCAVYLGCFCILSRKAGGHERP